MSIDDHAGKYDSLREADATNALNWKMKFQRKRMDPRQEYARKAEKSLPQGTALRYSQFDTRF
jgi:hypothetical protein